jgi:phosphatidylinositol alpha-1,6-mannosyltransferase
VLLTVSRLDRRDRYKGHDRVIEAIPEIERLLGRTVRYRVVGAGDAIADLRSLAASAGIADRVTFLGRVDHQQLAAEYAGCDVFVMPSRMELNERGSWLGEGFGIVYAEAQAAGRPVVASSQGGAPETLLEGKSGYAVDPRSTEAIADACVKILSLPDRGRAMGAIGRQFVSEAFGIHSFEERLRRLLAHSGHAAQP